MTRRTEWVASPPTSGSRLRSTHRVAVLAVRLFAPPIGLPFLLFTTTWPWIGGGASSWRRHGIAASIAWAWLQRRSSSFQCPTTSRRHAIRGLRARRVDSASRDNGARAVDLRQGAERSRDMARIPQRPHANDGVDALLDQVDRAITAKRSIAAECTESIRIFPEQQSDAERDGLERRSVDAFTLLGLKRDRVGRTLEPIHRENAPLGIDDPVEGHP